MQLQVNGVPKQYIQMLVQIPQECADCDGAEYLGSRQLVEYVIGDTVMDPMVSPSYLYLGLTHSSLSGQQHREN